MKEYFKPTSRKILGVIILLFIFSMGGLIPYFADPTKFITGEQSILLGFPLVYGAIKGANIEGFTPVNLIINIIIFYLIVCIISIAFSGKKKEDKTNQEVKQEERKNYVSDSNSGGGNTSTSNQTQP